MPIKGIQAVNACKIRGRCESTCIYASFTVIFETFSDSNQTTHIDFYPLHSGSEIYKCNTSSFLHSHTILDHSKGQGEYWEMEGDLAQLIYKYSCILSILF